MKTTLGLLILGACLNGAPAEMGSQRAPRDISADTNPGSAFWRAAKPVLILNNTYGKEVPNHRTEVRSRWTKDNLYLLFTCHYDQLYLKPNPDTKNETNGLWEWDVAELFIGGDFQNIKHYKEFEVSPQAEWVDLDINRADPAKEGGWKWNAGMEAAARIDAGAKVWYAYMRIPWKAIDDKPAAVGSKYRANLFRCQGKDPGRKYMSWQPTQQATFHVPEAFGILRLE